MENHPAGWCRKIACWLTAIALSVAGVVFASPAPAATTDLPTTVSVTEASADNGLTVSIEGTGYTEDALPKPTAGSTSAGVYVALRDSETMPDEDVNADQGLAPAVTYVPLPALRNGALSTELKAPIDKLTSKAVHESTYEVIVWSAHGLITDATKVATTPVNLTDMQQEDLFPSPSPEPEPEPTNPEPTDPDPSPTTNPQPSPTTADPPSSPTQTTPASKQQTTLVVTGASAKNGLTVRVSGQGYTKKALPKPTAGSEPAGVYVALRDPTTMTDGQINADQGLPPAVAYVPFGSGISADGTFATNLNAPASKLKPNATYQVIVWSAHGNITNATKVSTNTVTLTQAQHDALFSGKGTAPGDDSTGDGSGNGDGSGTGGRSGTGGANGGSTTGGSDTPATGDDQNPADRQGSGSTSTDGKSRVVCTTEKVPGKPGSPQLTWGVKSSFVNYVQGGIAKGSVSATGGASRIGNGFQWGTGSGSLTDGGGTLSFPGSVHFTGHGGILNLTISNVRVKVTGSNSGTLIATVASQDMEGKKAGGQGLSLANLRFSSLGKTGGTASVTLTAAGAKAFAGFYNAGASMDSATVSIAGASAATTQKVCHDAQGKRVNADGTAFTEGASGPGANVNTGGYSTAGQDSSTAGWTLIGVGALLMLILTTGHLVRGRD